jgi:uncharacterized protein (DUF1501 family)
MTTRRIFLRNSALAMVGVGAAPLWLERALYAADAPSPRKKILVAIFLRGAADGLNIVVPHGDKAYYGLRPAIAIPRTDVLDLDGYFGLHPALAPLKPIYDQQHLAIVHAAGSPDPTRSHFDAQDYMESGTPGIKSTRNGWMNRALPKATQKPSPVRAVSLGAVMPRSLAGDNSAIALESLATFQVRDAEAARRFESLYLSSKDPVLRAAGRDTFEAVSLVQSIQRQPYTPEGGAQYPRDPLGNGLQQIARLIKADAGLEMAFADIGGWDHHVNEVALRPTEGPLANRLTILGQALGAFWQDLGDRMENVAVVTMSEFGRTARENGSRGTDHGHANVMFVLGGKVRGGKVYGRWPGLAPEVLYENRDLALTTDYRAVCSEVLARHLAQRNLEKIFPNMPQGAARFKLIRA